MRAYERSGNFALDRPVVLSFISWLSLAVLLLLGLMPIIWLIFEASATGPQVTQQSFFDNRTMNLLARSFYIAVASGAIAVILGTTCGVILSRVSFRGRWTILSMLFCVYCISPYVLALGWLGGGVTSSISSLLLGNKLALTWILGAANLPLVTLVVVAGCRCLPLEPEEAALLAASPAMAFRRVLLPAILPIVGVAFLLAFDIGLGDYAVASLLQIPTYPIEIFLYYAGSFQPSEAARACLPLVILGLAVSVGIASLLPKALVQGLLKTQSRDWTFSNKGRRLLIVALLLLLLISIVPPLTLLLLSLPSAGQTIDAISTGLDSIANSLLISILSAALAVVFGWFASSRVLLWRKAIRVPLIAALILPITVPGSAYGIGWIEMTGNIPLVGKLPGICVPAFSLAARFGGIAAIAFAIARLIPSQNSIDACMLQEGRPLRRDFAIVLPQIARTCLAIFAIIVALAVNAISILILTAPPGFEILPLRSDNLLHYGLAEEAAVLSITAGLLAALPILVVLGISGLRSRRERVC